MTRRQPGGRWCNVDDIPFLSGYAALPLSNGEPVSYRQRYQIDRPGSQVFSKIARPTSTPTVASSLCFPGQQADLAVGSRRGHPPGPVLN